MIIYEKNIIFNLRVVDQETEQLVYSDYFGTVEELNRFLGNPSIKEPLIPLITIDVCEIENDSKIVLKFGTELSCLYEMDEEELEEFNETLMEWIEPRPVNLLPKTFSNTPVPQKEKMPLETFQYLCPNCWNTADMCNCPSYPWYLVQIDADIADIIKVLNLKGYYTTTACSGHLENGMFAFYIGFKELHNFNIPDGFYWDDFNIRCKYNGETTDECIADKAKKLDEFLKCVNELPPINENAM